jgi:YD repeat-containing protein
LNRPAISDCFSSIAEPDYDSSRRSLALRKDSTVTKRHLIWALVVVAVLGGAVFAQPNDPLIGTWKLNAAKSKGVKSGTTRVEAVGDAVKFTVDVVRAVDDTPRHYEYSGKYDGKDNPATGDSPYGDTVALTHVDGKTTRQTWKQSGKVTVTVTIVVSADGKTRTAAVKGKDAKGQSVDTLSFYERQ